MNNHEKIQKIHPFPVNAIKSYQVCDSDSAAQVQTAKCTTSRYSYTHASAKHETSESMTP